MGSSSLNLLNFSKRDLLSASTMASNKPYSTPTTLEAVRDYVTDTSNTSISQSPDLLLLNVQHANLKVTRLSEIRMNRHTTIDELKQRLYLHTGTKPSFMRLILRSAMGQVKAQLANEQNTLMQYGAVTGDTLYMIDDDAHSASANGWLEDTSLVEKYVLSDDAYDKKENTYRKFKQKMREKDPNWSMTSALAKNLNSVTKRPVDAADIAEEQPKIKVGDRVEVFPGARRADVRFIGRTLKDMPEGWWVGVAYDDLSERMMVR